jgi:hypothetical protein
MAEDSTQEAGIRQEKIATNTLKLDALSAE